MGDKQPCKVCGEQTIYIMNIKLKAVPICDDCAATITMQQVDWWVNEGESGLK